MVLTNAEIADSQPCNSSIIKMASTSSSRTKECTPIAPKNETVGMSIVREKLQSKGVQGAAANIILQGWRNSTRKHYDTYYKKWKQFCRRQQIDYLCPSQKFLLSFLSELYSLGHGYAAINSARSAISAIALDKSESLGKSPLICKSSGPECPLTSTHREI